MVAACILYGDEIGVGPMQALASIHVVDGRPFPSAELLRALILAAGHSFRVLESTGTRCTVLGLRAGRPDNEAHTVTWDIEMARAAGLAGKGAWRSYPRALLLARASTDLARMAFPDVVKGLGHVPDSATVAEDYDALAVASGLPDNPPPVERKAVQWKGARPPTAPPTAPPPETPNGGPDYPFGDEDPTPPPEAPQPPSTPPEDTPEAIRVRAANVKRIMAAYNDLGYGDDRATRLALFSALVGRGVPTTNDLTPTEAMRLYGDIGRLRDGSLLAVADGHGGFAIHAGDSGPEDDEP